ncbi:MAG: PhzF family phenazine biosynthesis protein [Caldilineaceae bacterium]
MPSYPFMQVDAFTDHRLGGNPCAILFDTDDLDAATMQAIARENNLSETSFVMKSQIADVRARYFTPATEIPLAGHPTIATIFALVESGRLQLTGDLTTISLELNVGPIRVDVYANGKTVQKVVMSQKKPQFLRVLEPEEILPAFNLTKADFAPNAPPQVVSTGTAQLMVLLRSHDALRRLDDVNLSELRRILASGEFFGIHFFCLQGATEQGDSFARFVVEGFEDPYTGSATGNMGAYLWHHGLIEQPTFVAEQGHWMGRPGTGYVEVIGPRHDIETVKVGGSAVTVIRGEFVV